jgi:hypothetical protein
MFKGPSLSLCYMTTLPPGWVKLPDRTPRPQPPEPDLNQLMSDAILAMKARWYRFNEERDLFYDYDHVPDDASDDEPEEPVEYEILLYD